MSDITTFLRALWRNVPAGDGTVFLGWVSQDQQAYWTSYARQQGRAFVETAAAWGAEERHVYVRPARYRAGATNALDEAIRWIAALHVDIDLKDHAGLSGQEIVSALKGHPDVPPPTILVRTGGGIHAYWRLTEPIDANVPGALGRARAAMVELARIFGGDLGAAKPGQAMRLPGTLNPKYKPARPVACRVFDRGDIAFTSLETKLYSARQVIPADPDADIADPDIVRLRVVARRLKARLERGAGDPLDPETALADLTTPGHRNNAVARLAGALFNEGYSVAEAQAWIAAHGNLYDRKTEQTVASIARKATRSGQSIYATFPERTAVGRGPAAELEPAQPAFARAQEPPPPAPVLGGGLPFRGRARGRRPLDPVATLKTDLPNQRSPYDQLSARLARRV